MIFKERLGIKNLGAYKSFTAVHSYREWTDLHNINSETDITDINSLLREAKYLLEKLLDVYEKV